ATVAFGNLNRTLYITGGQQLLLADGTIRTANGGLLALPGANIGKFSDNVFAVVPEVGVNIGYQLTPRMRFFVGYNFLYLANVLRPGSAVDTVVDAARIPNFPLPNNPAPLPTIPPRPTALVRSSDIFAQGISFGLHFTW
ncbi:MAG: BBP7 family outer membrane beta-barrel protein, partial [Candidatus Bilamarchaeaceae archaeon]